MRLSPAFPLAVVVSLLIVSCAPLSIAPPLPLPDADHLLREIRQRQEDIRGLKGLAWVRVETPKGRLRLQQALAVQRPGFLRLETLSPLGNPQLYLVTDGQHITLYHPGEHRFYHGPYQIVEDPSKLTLLPALTAEEIVSFLLAVVPPLEPIQSFLEADRNSSLWAITLESGRPQTRTTLWVDPRSSMVVRGKAQRPSCSYSWSFSEFRSVNGLQFPYRLFLEGTSSEVRIWVEYMEVELNPPWEEKDFFLPPPPGAQVSPLP